MKLSEELQAAVPKAQSIEAALDASEKNLTEVLNKVDALTAERDGLKTSLDQAETEIAGLKARVAELEAGHTPGPQPAGQFKVRNGEIFDLAGKPFSPVGAAIFASQPEMVQAATKLWKFNVVRVVINPWETANKYPGLGSEADAHARLGETIEAGAVGIADIHYIGGTGTLARAQEIDAINSRLIGKFGNEPRLWFELFNEFGYNQGLVQSGGTWKIDDNYAQQAISFFRDRIAFIRGRGCEQPILVSSIQWAQDLLRTLGYQSVDSLPLSEASFILKYGKQIVQGFDNIVLVVHAYNSWAKTARAFGDFATAAKTAGLCFIVSETGSDNAKENTSVAFRKVFAALKEGFSFGVIGWHAKSDQAGFTKLRDLSKFTGDLRTAGDLTEMGGLFRERLLSLGMI